MSGIKSVFLSVMTFLLSPPARGDVEVSCVFNESCILPCRFQAVDEDHNLIDWTHETAGNVPVHSYCYNQDQLSHQNQRFRDRTSLFNDQISRGNAALQLTGVEVQDQGRYKCYTNTITEDKETFINLKVDAPVRKVDIQQVENKITCRSDRIYPEPELTWSTNPPSNMTLQNKTEVQQTEQQLYNIISSLILSDSAGDLTYICTVSTQTSSRRASLKTLHSSTNVAGIVGGVVGAVLCVVLIVLVVYWIYKKVRKDEQTNQTEARDQQNPGPSNGVSNPAEDILLNERENGGE